MVEPLTRMAAVLHDAPFGAGPAADQLKLTVAELPLQLTEALPEPQAGTDTPAPVTWVHWGGSAAAIGLPPGVFANAKMPAAAIRPLPRMRPEAVFRSNRLSIFMACTLAIIAASFSTRNEPYPHERTLRVRGSLGSPPGRQRARLPRPQGCCQGKLRASRRD